MAEWFFTAKKLSEGTKKLITKYINKFKHKEVKELLDRDQFSNHYICPLCRTLYPEIPYFLDHFRFYKHRWELRLLNRIREYGPRKLPVQDAFEWHENDDSVLEDQIKFWILCMKIHEATTMLPIFQENEDWADKNWVNRIFWEQEKKVRGRQTEL